ncbi:MAG TPA: AAA family ATPase [Parachlamydiaceae bacterium]|nr:AAA family ATPase [Parachlamydiaceae bacterium]
MNILPAISLSGPSLENMAYAAGGFAIGIVPTLYQRFKPIPPADHDQKIKDLFKKLLITEWHLPGLSTNSNIDTNERDPKPIFNKKINEDIAVIKQRMERSRDNNGKSPLPNLLIKGEPGVGKTMLLKNLCIESGTGFIRVPSGAMESHLKTGSHITTLHSIFEVAEQCSKPVHIIMDDGEQLLTQRPEINAVASRETIKAEWIVDKEKMSETIAQRRIALVNAILEEAGKDQRKISFALTTNRPKVIDKAFLTRAHTIKISPPMENERRHIIITHLSSIFNNDLNILSFFNTRILDDMAKKTEGFTGRNIVIMLNDLQACVQLEEGNIRDELIDASIVAMQASIEPKKEVEVKAVVQPAPVAIVIDQEEAYEEYEEPTDTFLEIKNKFWEITGKVQVAAAKLKQSLIETKNKFSAQ